MMKKTLCVAVIAMAMAAGAAAQAAPICLNTNDMLETKPAKDGASILVKMRDGSEWRNNLRSRCSDLRFDGFVWGTRGPGDSVCEDIQSIHVLRSGQVCMLGKFTEIKPARAERHAER